MQFADGADRPASGQNAAGTARASVMALRIRRSGEFDGIEFERPEQPLDRALEVVKIARRLLGVPGERIARTAPQSGDHFGLLGQVAAGALQEDLADLEDLQPPRLLGEVEPQGFQQPGHERRAHDGLILGQGIEHGDGLPPRVPVREHETVAGPAVNEAVRDHFGEAEAGQYGLDALTQLQPASGRAFARGQARVGGRDGFEAREPRHFLDEVLRARDVDAERGRRDAQFVTAGRGFDLESDRGEQAGDFLLGHARTQDPMGASDAQLDGPGRPRTRVGVDDAADHASAADGRHQGRGPVGREHGAGGVHPPLEAP